MTEKLEAALAAMRTGDLRAALTALIAAWQRVPATALADAVATIGARAQLGLEPPDGKTAKLRDEAWFAAAAAGDPIVRGTLVDTLKSTRGTTGTLARIQALVPARDPRVTKKIIDFIAVPVFTVQNTSGACDFWEAMLGLLPALGDPRVGECELVALATMEQFIRDRWIRDDAGVGALRAELARIYRGAPVLETHDAALVREIVDAIPAAPKPVIPASNAGAEPELLAQIYAAPADDHPREVYADWLQERGDPRGDFIALQLARLRGEPIDEAREKQLLAKHAVAWLGPLAAKLTKASVVFERGFVATGSIKDKAAIDDEPAWATVRELADLRDHHIPQLAALRRPMPLECIGWLGPFHRNIKKPVMKLMPTSQVAIAAFGKISQLPALRRLGLRGIAPRTNDRFLPEHFAWLWKAPVSKALVELAIGLHASRLPIWLPALAQTPLERLVVHTGTGVRSCRFELTRARKRGPFSRAVIHGLLTAAPAELAVLGAIPDQLVSVQVVVPASKANELRRPLESALAGQSNLAKLELIEA